MLIEYSIDDIANDKSIIAIPINIFNEIAYSRTTTIGAREILTKIVAISNSSDPSLCYN